MNQEIIKELEKEQLKSEVPQFHVIQYVSRTGSRKATAKEYRSLKAQSSRSRAAAQGLPLPFVKNPPVSASRRHGPCTPLT